MGIPGKPLHLTKDEIVDALVKENGRIIHAAHSLGINPDTLYKYFKKNPDMWDALDEIRKNYNRYERHVKIESSKSVLDKLLEKVETHPSTALRAAMYYLDNLGNQEGYGKKIEELAEQKKEDLFSQLNPL